MAPRASFKSSKSDNGPFNRVVCSNWLVPKSDTRPYTYVEGRNNDRFKYRTNRNDTVVKYKPNKFSNEKRNVLLKNDCNVRGVKFERFSFRISMKHTSHENGLVRKIELHEYVRACERCVFVNKL